MPAGRVVPASLSKSHASYYVALGVIVGLLALLCCYACYFFITKVRELSSNDSPWTTPSTSCPKKETVSYPVQPVVRDSAAAMAALCRQLPAGYALQGDQVFPAGRSPDPRPADTGPSPPGPPGPPEPPAPPGNTVVPPCADLPPNKVPVPTVTEPPCITLEAAG